ncbi:CD180 antigen [Elgaria multicarinata webbii]|uniref:CD180 antigen n=1 Tax=Elgaria multicarinata webbii TaxID=159646 RepID=UPI002FCD6A6C
MAWCTYCWALMGLLGVSCEETKPVDKMCTELIANRSYSCEGLGLTEIPEQLPFITKVLDFSFNFLNSLQCNTFSKLTDLVYLDLTRCQINWVYDGAFESNYHLESIVLTGNNLLFLASTAFTGPWSMKLLDLTQTGLTSLTFIPMEGLDNLETLILGNNHIQSLALPPDFPTRNLKYLDLQMNIIQRISATDIHLLKQTRNLTLSLMGNDIVHIEPRAFRSISFASLDFGSCVNVSVILEGLQDAKTVALQLGTFVDPHVLDISPAMLQGICNISVDDLALQYRSFTPFSADTFQCLGKLQRLDLAHTSLHKLPTGLLEMNVLKELNLNQNKFDHLCKIMSSAFPHLTHLYIRENSESLDLGSGCLESLSKLQHLDLSKSQIENLDCCGKQLRGLSSLQHLDLSFNNKLLFHSVAFNDCANLKILDLSFTHIILTNSSQGPFCNLHFLQTLNLSFSRINPNTKNILQGLKSLIVLNMNGNNFESGTILNDNLFQQAPNLEVLTLSSCKLLTVQSKAFSALRKLKYVDLSHNNLTAFSSDAFSNLRNIYLNFANNRIHIIPRDMLTNLSGQSVINLSYNPLECICSNIGLLTWYKQNIDKIEDSEETVCSEPKSLAGAKLFSVNLSCGYSTAKVILIIFVVITVIVVTFILIVRFLRRRYEHI